MNIVQLHNRVLFWIDTVASDRFQSDDIDNALNAAINDIVDEKYDHSRLNHRGDSFQKTQRVRDELSNIVKLDDTDTNLTMANNPDHVLLEVASIPSDYAYLLSIALYVGTSKYNCWPLTYDRKNVVQNNPYRRVRTSPSVKCYFIEGSSGIKIYHPFSESDPDKVEIDYLAKPVDVFFGFEKDQNDTIGFSTPFITALNPTSYKGVEYASGIALTTDGVDDAIDYGLAVVDYVNPQINGFLHEEVARRAALNCLTSAGNFEKVQVLKAEILAT